MAGRAYRAGESIDDLCRACKADRAHTVIVADGDGRALRVQCDFCGSQHAYRGGGRAAASPAAPRVESRSHPGPRPGSAPGAPAASTASGLPGAPAASTASRLPGAGGAGHPPALVSARECAEDPLMVDAGPDGQVGLEMLLRRVIREEAGLTPVAPAERWRGGSLVLRPANPAVQEKSWPIETFFHKVVMIRNRLRTLEQQVNALPLEEDAKLKLQGYITGCYGTLTSFNVLFAEADDQFKGASSD